MRRLLRYCPPYMPRRTFAPGEVLLREGERAGVLLILIEGAVEILKGDYRIDTVAEPGAVFGELSVLLDAPHMATVKATAESRFYVAEDPIKFLRSHPEVALAISQLLAKRLNAMTSYLVDLKHQFEGHDDHFGMIDEVLDTLVHAQDEEHEPGSERDPDPTVY
jgi:CRP/FNR family transcriptional regulator, cyclic AMP receptor protein